jgi:hypothetical protein
MTIPAGGFSPTPVVSALLSPDSFPRLDTRVDFERGGVALNDPTQGYNIRDWQVGTDGTDIWVCTYPEQSPRTVYYTGADITEVSLAFDQNMAPTLAWVEAGLVKLRWFNSLTSSTVITTYPGARTPMLTLDDKRPIANASNDIIFAYIRDGNVCYREQRNRYETENVLGAVPSQASRLIQLGMGKNLRLQFKVTVIPNALHADRLTDTVYALTGDDIRGVGKGTVETAVWRSKVFRANEVPVMGWARVLGDYPLTLRVIGDGAFQTVTTITSDDPVRLRPGRWREWAVEVEGETRAVSLRLAQAVEELWD